MEKIADEEAKSKDVLDEKLKLEQELLDLKEDLTKVEQTNFDTYKWQTIVGTPEINIKLLENSNYPSGAGEPATSIVAPAICNAIFAASNVRLRELPITRERFASAVSEANSGD